MAERAHEGEGEGQEDRLEQALRFLRRRLAGDYQVDEFGFDPHLTDAVVLPMLRPFYEKWFRVEARGMHHVPATGAALLVANHSGTVPVDALMTQLAIHDHHPAGRRLRVLGADLVFRTPFVGELARKSGATLAAGADVDRLLARGELVGVWPEGFKGIGKPFWGRRRSVRCSAGWSRWRDAWDCPTCRSPRPSRGWAPSASSPCRPSG